MATGVRSWPQWGFGNRVEPSPFLEAPGYAGVIGLCADYGPGESRLRALQREKHTRTYENAAPRGERGGRRGFDCATTYGAKVICRAFVVLTKVPQGPWRSR